MHTDELALTLSKELTASARRAREAEQVFGKLKPIGKIYFGWSKSKILIQCGDHAYEAEIKEV